MVSVKKSPQKGRRKIKNEWLLRYRIRGRRATRRPGRAGGSLTNTRRQKELIAPFYFLPALKQLFLSCSLCGEVYRREKRRSSTTGTGTGSERRAAGLPGWTRDEKTPGPPGPRALYPLYYCQSVVKCLHKRDENEAFAKQLGASFVVTLTTKSVMRHSV